MANPAHKRADGRAAKSPSGHAITDHADCCDCHGGGSSPCSCYPILFTSDQRTCGIPDGSVPGIRSVVVADISVTYSEQKLYVPTGQLVSDVPQQTVTKQIASEILPGVCGTVIRNNTPSTLIQFTQRARGASPASAAVNITGGNQSSSPGWNVPTGRRSQWARIGTPVRSAQPGPCFFEVGADSQSAGSGVRIFGGVGDSTLFDDIYSVWNGSSSSLYGQTVPFGVYATGGTVSGSATVVMTTGRSNCELALDYRSSGATTNTAGDFIYSMSYTVELHIRNRLVQCGTSGNGLRGPGGSMVDPAVDALVRGYGGCKGCGDGNPMA